MIIRESRMDDAPLLHKELGCNSEMTRYSGWNPYATLEMASEFLANASSSEGEYSWVIEQDGQPVGIIGAYDYDDSNHSIEIGYSIFQKYWGKGYATKAVALACDFLRSTSSIQCIKAWSAKENIASINVLEKNGFKVTKIEESAINVDGDVYDQVIYQRLL